jgi:hypothetical protein
MNFRQSRNSGLRLLATLGMLALAGTLPASALAQDSSPSAAPAETIQIGEATGGAGYAIPNDVYVPASSIAEPGSAGKFAHTTYVLPTVLNGNMMPSPSVTLPGGETPASLECVYGIKGLYSSGCPKSAFGAETTSGWGTIALVEPTITRTRLPTTLRSRRHSDCQLQASAKSMRTATAIAKLQPQMPVGR